MANESLLYVGIRGTVLALDRGTGIEIWRRILKSTDFVNVAIVDGDLYASARGELYALDPATGEIRWHNPLKGFGWGLVSIAGAANQAALAGEKRRRDAQRAAAAS